MNASGAAIVRIAGVGHAYGKVSALDALSLELEAGQMTGIVGPDGAGKSTLLSLIAGARKLQTGSAEVLGGSMADVRHRQDVCTRIAFMPQGLGKNLYQEISVAENLTFFGTLFGLGRKEREIRINRLAAATGLLPFLDRPAGKLSGGMKQKLGLCCALIHDPDLLILDEPTTGVDPLSRRQFWTLIAELRRDRPTMSVIVSTAYMDEAVHCDWLVAMDHGKVLAAGTANSLRKATGERDLESVFAALQRGQEDPKTRLILPPYIPSTDEPVIVAKDLTCRFGDFTAVDSVSFTIQKGEIFGFLGSNGCGKTTTMKMLTGLLAPTEGQAELYGTPVDADDLSVRRRVGFMTQSFSLYGELSVRQNLTLHARLFHLNGRESAARSEKLIAEMGLADYADADANSLPLGVRQRLSLAVATVHEPELLILAEPPSGVDPHAREEFWRLLIDLSRNQRVTVFVATHFMSEAMRCDRISLMHAGRVLVSDTPGNVISSRESVDLESAFITYIEEAEQFNSVLPAQMDVPPPQEVPANTHGRPRFMALQRLLAYAQCEMLSLMRDPIRLAFAFLGSFVMMLLFGFGMSADVTNLTYAAFDHDNTPESRAYLANFASSRYFTERAPIRSLEEMEGRLKSNDITLVLEIPPNFGQMVKRGSADSVSAWIDGAHTQRAGTIEGYVQQAHEHFLQQRNREMGATSASRLPTTLQVRFRYNPTNESIYAMGPAVPAMLLMMFLAILMAVSVAREKEIGTITNFYVTPTGRLEFLVGKQLPYLGIGMAIALIMTASVMLIFEVPLKGNGLALILGALLYTAAATSYGLFISSLTRSQVAAVFAGAVLSMLPTMQFSGMIQPVSTLTGGARVMGSLWPTTYYRNLSVGAFTKGLSFADLAPDLFALALFPPAFWLLAALLLKKQEK